MTLDETKAAILSGAPFGDCYPSLPFDDDRAALRAWFVSTPGVPKDPQKPAATARPESRQLGYTGGVCVRCQGARLVRTGPCERCEDCGETSGGCS